MSRVAAIAAAGASRANSRGLAHALFTGSLQVATDRDPLEAVYTRYPHSYLRRDTFGEYTKTWWWTMVHAADPHVYFSYTLLRGTDNT